MRIVCQSCAAAYAIDDRHVTPRGVRAQCPRCKHQQVVKREEPSAAPPGAPVQAEAPAPPSVPAVPPHAGAAPAPRPATAAARPAPALPPSDAAAVRAGPAATPLPPAPARPAPVRIAAAERSAPPPIPAVTAPPRDERPAARVERLDLAASCERCGRRLEGGVEQALGTCAACRDSEAAPPGSAAPVRIALGAGPLRAGAALPPSEVRTERTLPISPMASMQREAAPRPRWPLALAAAGAGVLLLGGAAYYTLRERARAQREAAQEKPLPAAVQAVLPRWRLMHVDVQGSAEAQLAEGQRLLAPDEQAAYQDAEEAFQRALVLDPRSEPAISGYVTALALGRGRALESETYDEALALVGAARGPGLLGAPPRLQLAHAALLQTRTGEAEQAQARELAEDVLTRRSSTAEEKAQAHLLLGRAFAHSSLGLAQPHFDAALSLSPRLSRVHHERALAAEAAGELRLAIQALEQRLALDPGHRESVGALAQVFLEVGELERARALYEAQARAYPRELRAQLPLAVLRYQVDGAPAAAAAQLRGLLRERTQQPAEDVAAALVHLAAAERAAERPAQAERAAREALGLRPDLPAAHLQLFLVALQRRDAAAAAPHLEPARAAVGDAALGQLLLGRLRLLQAQPAQALAAFVEAHRLEARRTDALLLAGVAGAQAGQRDEAARVLFQALQADPQRLAPRPVVTSAYLQPQDLLRGVEGGLAGLASGPQDVLPSLYEGLLRFHQGALPDADRLLQRALEQDPANAPALAYRALIALKQRGGAAALPLAQRAVAQGRRVAVAQLALGLALAESGPRQSEPAQRALREALALSPPLLSAEVELAKLEAGASRGSARARLLRAVGLDPAYLVAKRALFALEQ